MTGRQNTNEKPCDASGYDAFEKLTKDLLTVGKQDLDEARARGKTQKS